jgi:hypothetical protein
MPDARLFEFTLSKESLNQMWISGWFGLTTAPASITSQKAFYVYLDSLEAVQPWDGPTTSPVLVVPFTAP